MGLRLADEAVRCGTTAVSRGSSSGRSKPGHGRRQSAPGWQQQQQPQRLHACLCCALLCGAGHAPQVLPRQDRHCVERHQARGGRGAVEEGARRGVPLCCDVFWPAAPSAGGCGRAAGQQNMDGTAPASWFAAGQPAAAGVGSGAAHTWQQRQRLVQRVWREG
jgi:hypothetical protein